MFCNESVSIDSSSSTSFEHVHESEVDLLYIVTALTFLFFILVVAVVVGPRRAKNLFNAVQKQFQKAKNGAKKTDIEQPAS